MPLPAAAAALLALLALGAAGPARPRRSSPPFEPFLSDPLYMGDEFTQRAADPPPGIPPFAYSWVKAALAHAEALTKQAQQLAEALLNGQLPGWPSRRADEDEEEHDHAEEQDENVDDAELAAQAEEAAKAEKARQDEEKAKEEAAKVAAMQALIHEEQLKMQERIKEAQETMQKQLAEVTQGLSHLLRFRREAAPMKTKPRGPEGPGGGSRSALEAAFAAVLPGLRQMDELIRIQSGAPLHTVRLPGFPAHLFRPGGGFALPGFLPGFELAQQRGDDDTQSNEVPDDDTSSLGSRNLNYV